MAKKNDKGARYVELQIEVPGTPEQVWNAIATGPGVSSWFAPTQIEEREGGSLHFDLAPGIESNATVTCWQPCQKFAYVEREWNGDAPPLATEYTVNSLAGGRCVVRLVQSLFTDSSEWDDQLDGFESGWSTFLPILRALLTYYRREKQAVPMRLVGTSTISESDTWKAIQAELGIENLEVGKSVKLASPDGRHVLGEVLGVGTPKSRRQVLIRMEQPTSGLFYLGAHDVGPCVFVLVCSLTCGDDATDRAAQLRKCWENWLKARFPNFSQSVPDQIPNRLTVESRSTHRFQISAEQVYDAWIDPNQVRQWMSSALKGFGLPGEMRRVEIDPHVGGKFCFSDLRNGIEAVHQGEYLELNRPHSISFTWVVGDCQQGSEPAESADLPSRVRLTIEPDGTGCVATIVHEMDAKWAEFVDRTAQGWTRMLVATESLIVHAPK